MQLHDLKSHPVIKFFAYAGFFLIIISFVFFYGWGKNTQRKEQVEQRVARFKADDSMSFLPWRKWEYIAASEVAPARRQVIDRKIQLLGPEFGQLLSQQRMDLTGLATDKEAIQQAMDTRLLNEEAKRLGIVVTQEEIDNYIRQSGWTAASLDGYLKTNNMTLDQFRNQLRQSQAALRAQNYIANQARASLYELWLEYVLVNEKITLKIAPYSIDKFEDKIQVTDAELQPYLDEHKKEFEVPAKRRYAYVKISMDDLKKKIEPTADQVKAYYEQHPADFKRDETVKVEDVFAPVNADQPTTAAQALLTAFKDSVTSGADWDQLVANVREKNDKARIYHREVGWIGRDQTSSSVYGKPYLDRAFGLNNDEVSSSVQSPSGFNVIHRLESLPAGVKTLDEVKDDATERFKDDKASEQFKAEAKRLKDELATKRYKTIREFAAGVKLEDGITTTVLASSATIPEVGGFPRDQTYLDSLKEGVLSGLFQSTEVLAVLQIVQEEKGHPATLAEVRESITAEVKAKKAAELAKAAADKAMNNIKTGAEFETAVADAPTTTVLTLPFTRGQPISDLGAPLIEFTEQSTKIDQGSTGISSYGRSADSPVGYAIWKVEKIDQPSRDQFKKDRRKFEHDFLQLKQLTTIEEWLADKRREAGFQLMTEIAKKAEPESEEPTKDEKGGKKTADAAGGAAKGS